MSMQKCAITRLLILSLICCVPLWAQDNAPADAASDQAQASSQDDSALPEPASYDDVVAPGQIHGFIPDNWTGGMVTLADLQTQEGQDWLNGLTAAQSAHDQTQYVCQNPGPTTTSSDTGDFYFYDLPAGSYAIAGCMQTPDGHWRSGAQVLSLDAGQDELIALGPSGGPIMRDGEAFVPAYYVGFWEPMWFGPGWSWGWHPAAAWQASAYYHVPAYRSAPLWVRPAPVVVGARIVVPPYKLVIAGNYHYLAFRNGAFVRESPRVGYVLPPQHVFHPITPAMEVKMRDGFQERPGVFGGVQVNAAVQAPQPAAPAGHSPFVNYRPTPAVGNTSQPNNGAVRNAGGGSARYTNSGNSNPGYSNPGNSNPGNTYHPPVRNNPNPYTPPTPQYHEPPTPPHEEHHEAPPTKPATTNKKPY